MTRPSLNLFKHRPFVLATIWEAACIVLAILAFMRTPNPLYIIAGMIIGGTPMVLVILELARSAKDNAARGRSEDIVQ